MSAFRQAVLSVAPDRLEKFSNEVKKTIRKKHSTSSNKRKSETSTDKSSHSKTKRHRKHSSHESETKSGLKKDQNGSSKKNESSKHGSVRRLHSKDKKRSSRKTSTNSKKPKKHKKASDESDFDPKDLDLTIPVVPLGELIKNRQLLLDTVFSIIQGPKLTAMLPDILKLKPLEEIKILCNEQLDVMSSKRINHIIAGTEMVSSSGTDSSDNEAEKRSLKPKVSMKTDHSLQANFIDSTTSDHTPTGPSMLFPSAISTAQAAMANNDNIPIIKEIKNDNSDHDTVSTSTEPNFIYNEEDDMESFHSSDTEEGEVQTSDDEVYENVDSDSENKVVNKKDQTDADEVVLVEFEEVEEDSDHEHHTRDVKEQSQQKCNVAIKKISKQKTKSHMETEVIELDIDSMLEQDIDYPCVEDSPVPEPQAEDKSEPPGDPAATKDSYEGKSQLEVLELELRARAIRSLMKAAQAGKLKSAEK